MFESPSCTRLAATGTDLKEGGCPCTIHIEHCGQHTLETGISNATYSMALDIRVKRANKLPEDIYDILVLMKVPVFEEIVKAAEEGMTCRQ